MVVHHTCKCTHMSYDRVSYTSTRESCFTVVAMIGIQHLAAKLFFWICFNSVLLHHKGRGAIKQWNPLQSLTKTEKCTDVTKDNWYKSIFEDKNIALLVSPKTLTILAVKSLILGMQILSHSLKQLVEL